MEKQIEEWYEIYEQIKYTTGCYDDNARQVTDIIVDDLGYRKQVEAEWIDLHKGKYENPLYVCSVCGKGAFLKIEADELNNPKMVQALTPYCPHCSAKMKGAE